MIFADNSAFAKRSSAFGSFRSANTFPEPGVNFRLGISITSLPGQLVCKLEPLPDQFHFSKAGSRFPISPSSGTYEGRRPRPQPEPRTRLDTSHSGHPRALANRVRKAAQDLRALMSLAN